VKLHTLISTYIHIHTHIQTIDVEELHRETIRRIKQDVASGRYVPTLISCVLSLSLANVSYYKAHQKRCGEWTVFAHTESVDAHKVILNDDEDMYPYKRCLPIYKICTHIENVYPYRRYVYI
jgi:hypothetical protein